MKKRILIILNYIFLSICSLKVFAEVVNSVNSSEKFEDLVCTKA